MNANLFHNLLNIAGLIIGVLVSFDWTQFGVDSPTALKIVGALMLIQNLVKLGINVTRDGLTGLAAPQPPVEK